MSPMALSHSPGFIAVSGLSASVGRLCELTTFTRTDLTEPLAIGTVLLATWGIAPPEDSAPILLSRAPRLPSGPVGREQLAQIWSDGGGRGLAAVLPPFAALRTDQGGIEVTTDALGHRHLYYGETPDSSVVSTSARAVATWLGADLDREAVAVQSLLGWQLRNRTLFRGVHKLPAGHILRLSDGRTQVRRYEPESPPQRLELAEAIPAAAAVLRDSLSTYLDDHPDALLQLSGGQDSRLVLGAIPEHRRTGLRAMTLGLPNDPDVQIAQRLAARYGMRHQLISVEGLDAVSAEDAHTMVTLAARRLEFMSDPLAFASLSWIEQHLEQGPRITGIGGEFVRGNYYFGPAVRLPVTRGLTRALSSWRLFSHESAAPEIFQPDFREWAISFTLDDLHGILSSLDPDWLTSTDEFYMEYMRRWAGVSTTATALDRQVCQPLLDGRFIAIARGLRPADKAGNRFVSRLQVELDPALARIPLDERLAPIVYARTTPKHLALRSAWKAGQVVGKVRQLLQRRQRASVGGPALARKVVEFWRAHPESLTHVRDLGIVRPDWLDDLVSGRTEAGTSTVALLVNLTAATTDELIP